MRIFPKTFFYTLALLTLIALLASGLIYTLLPHFYTNQKRQTLTNQADWLVQRLETAKREDIVSLMGTSAIPGQSNIVIQLGEDNYSFSKAEMSGDITTSVIVTSMTYPDQQSGQDNTAPSSSATLTDGDTSRVYHIIIPEDFLSLDQDSIHVPANTMKASRSFTMEGEAGTLTVSMTLAPVREAAAVIVSLLPLSLLLCIAIAVVFSLLYARAITRPIKAISGVTRQMTLLEPDARCTVRSKDEFGQLADDLNGLYRKLLCTIVSLEAELKKTEAAEKAKTDFLRAASHELKTPVTAISVIMDNMMLGIGKYKDHDQWLPKCKELTDTLSSKLHDILDASRQEDFFLQDSLCQAFPDPASSHRETASQPNAAISIETICTEVLEPYLILARTRGLSVTTDWKESFPVTVPPKPLEKALSSLFSNAVLYAVPGGAVFVHCRERRLIIENECVPIPAEQIARLYEPFYRPDFSRSRETGGNGLGLYLVETILRRLGLEYCFEPMAEPEGMRFTIYF